MRLGTRWITAKYNMVKRGLFQILRPAGRRLTVRLRVKGRACALLLLAPAIVAAQSADLLRAYKNFETAKAANKVADALKYGDDALTLTEEAGDKRGLVELLCNLGE